jgi:hypothetical protein
MRKSILTRRNGIERLEDRSVLNGTVTATGAGGTLILTGDAENNAISVIQVSKNSDGSGAIIRVTDAGTKINNLDTGKTGTTFTFGSGAGNSITSIDIELAGGRDTLTFANTTVTGSITVNMDDQDSGGTGDGNDVLATANVHSTSDVITIGLGNGTNVATLVNVSSGSDFTLTGGDGRDVVALNTVRSNASPEASNDTFTVDLEGGNFDTLAVVNCSDGTGDFSDSGRNGIISGAGNHFDNQTITGFDFRFGDLRNDKPPV